MRWNLKEAVSKSLVRRTEITYKARLRETSWLVTTKSKHYVIGGRIKLGFKESFQIYCEGLKTELSQIKLRAPIFLGLTVGINIIMPITNFITNVLIKHKPMNPHDFVSVTIVAAIFACIYALIVSAKNIGKEQCGSYEMEPRNKKKS